MARIVAIALIALVAASLVADSSAAFCRTSSYLLNGKIVEANKNTMFKACGANVKVLKTEMKADGCFVMVQQVDNEAAWKKYSDCEKADAQKTQYTPLKSASDACKKHQASGDC